MRTPVIATVLAMFLCSGAKAQLREPDILMDRAGWFKAQIDCGIKLAITEAGNQSDEGQRQVVWVAARRALKNRKDFGGSTICQVAYMQTKAKDGEVVSQFTGMHKPLKLSRTHPKWIRADRNTRAVLLGDWKPREELREALFYLNPKYSKPSRRAWMEKTQRKAGVLEDHHYYGEKT